MITIKPTQKNFEPQSHRDTEKIKNLCASVPSWLIQFESGTR
jgi:hypothetical protein